MTTARLKVNLLSLAIVICWLASCGASQRDKVIRTTLTATDAAAKAFVLFDARHQADIVEAATDLTTGKEALAKYREQQAQVESVIASTYRAIAVAATLNDDASIHGMLETALILETELKSVGVIK